MATTTAPLLRPDLLCSCSVSQTDKPILCSQGHFSFTLSLSLSLLQAPSIYFLIKSGQNSEFRKKEIERKTHKHTQNRTEQNRERERKRIFHFHIPTKESLSPSSELHKNHHSQFLTFTNQNLLFPFALNLFFFFFALFCSTLFYSPVFSTTS